MQVAHVQVPLVIQLPVLLHVDVTLPAMPGMHAAVQTPPCTAAAASGLLQFHAVVLDGSGALAAGHLAAEGGERGGGGEGSTVSPQLGTSADVDVGNRLEVVVCQHAGCVVPCWTEMCSGARNNFTVL
jgi:hypothetical protein